MQKSALPAKPAPRPAPRSMGPAADIDKGQKHEPFFSAALMGDLRSRERLLKADQKR